MLTSAPKFEWQELFCRDVCFFHFRINSFFFFPSDLWYVLFCWSVFCFRGFDIFALCNQVFCRTWIVIVAMTKFRY